MNVACNPHDLLMLLALFWSIVVVLLLLRWTINGCLRAWQGG